MLKEKQPREKDLASELLKDLLIVELAKARVPQPEIRKIVGGEMARVNRIARYFKKRKAE
jgi:hypothetical protein